MASAAALLSAVVGVPVGWLAWRWAQTFIDARSLEKGDTEVRLPWPTAVMLTAAIFGALGWRFAGDALIIATYSLIFGLLVVLLLVDFGRYYLPNRLIALNLAVGIVAVVAVSIIKDNPAAIEFALVGVVMTFGVYVLFFVAALLLFGGHAFGLGDVKLSSVLGLAIGWVAPDYRSLFALLVWSVLIGFLSGAVVSIALLRGVKLKSAFPQGPFLILGTLAVVLFSAQILG